MASYLSEAHMMPDNLELLDCMQARLNEFLGDKTGLQKQFERVDERLKELYRTQGPRIRETEEDVDKQIKDLEFNRSTVKMGLQEEKKILRKIDDLKKLKPKIRAYKAGEEELAGLKRQKSALFDAIKSREATIAELNQNIRKLQLAERVGVPASELVSIVVDIPEAMISRVIGKGGQNLRQIEESCKVGIDVVDGKKAARVTGGASACQAARDKLEEITLSVVQDLPLTDNLLSVLMFQKGSLTQALQNKYNVRLDVLRAEGLLRVTGLPANVEAVTDAIADLDIGSVSVSVDTRLIPSVVGKGGSHFRKLEEDYSVAIDIDRLDSVIIIRGMTTQVELAADALRQIIETYEDREAEVTVDKFVARMLIDDKGNLLKEFRKETGCLVHIRRGEDSSSTTSTLVIKGQAYRLDDGVSELKKLIAELTSKVIEVVVDPELVRCIIGKKGATITRVRQETGAVVETDVGGSGVVKICSRDEAKRDHARDEILSIIEKNQLSEVCVCKESALALKSSKGTALREQCANELEVQMDIDGDTGAIRLRGPVPAMEEAKNRILSFAEENYGVEMDLIADDFVILTAGGQDNNLRKQIQESTGAALFAIKEDGILKIRGTREAVTAAEAAVLKALDSDDDGRTVLVPVAPEAMSFLIGKSGATINKLREEMGGDVDLTILKVRSQVRVRGSDASKVLEVKDALVKVLEELRGTFTVKATEAQQQELQASNDLQRLAREYDVSIDRGSDNIRVRGLVHEAAGAKARLSEFLSCRSKLVLPMPPSMSLALLAADDTTFKRIREGFAVSAEIDKVNSAVVIQGPVSNVSKAKEYTLGMLEVLFPSQFASLPVPMGAMPYLAGKAKAAKRKAGSGCEEEEATAGCQVWADREKDVMRCWGEKPQAVAAAIAQIRNDIKDWEATHAMVGFESWMYPLLIGKGGGRIKELEKEVGTTLTVDREAGVVKVKGANAEEVKGAVSKLTDVLDTIKRENAEVEVPREAAASLIGKKGANLTKIREESGATIDVPSNEGGKLKVLPVRIRATGEGCEEQVAKAKALILAFLSEWQKNNAMVEVSVSADKFPLVCGKGGVMARQIADESGAKIELHQDRGVVLIKGKAECVAAAQTAVQELLDEDRDYHMRPKEEDDDEVVVVAVEAVKEAKVVAAPVVVAPATTKAASQQQQKSSAHAQNGVAKAASSAAKTTIEAGAKKQAAASGAASEAPAVVPDAGLTTSNSNKAAVPTAPPAPSSSSSAPPPVDPKSKQQEPVPVNVPTLNGKRAPAATAKVQQLNQLPLGGAKGGAFSSVKGVAKTETANELLDLMLGRKSPSLTSSSPTATAIRGLPSSSSTATTTARGGSSNSNPPPVGQYYKSSSGLTVRL